MNAFLYIRTRIVHRSAETRALFSVWARARGELGRRGGAAPACGTHWGTGAPPSPPWDGTGCAGGGGELRPPAGPRRAAPGP